MVDKARGDRYIYSMNNGNPNNGAKKMNRKSRSNHYTKFVAGQGWTFDPEKARSEYAKGDHYVTTEGVVRWKSNGSVPPVDLLEDWTEAGCQGFDLAASLAARDADLDSFLSDYRANPPKLTDEDLFEMRAAFGPGAEVVDVITGRKIRL